MARLGRQLGGVTDGSIIQSAIMDPAISALDEGKVVYFDPGLGYFAIEAGTIDETVIENKLVPSLVGILSTFINPDKGNVVVFGSTYKSGANPGESYFLQPAGALTITPPTPPRVRIGYSAAVNSIFINIEYLDRFGFLIRVDDYGADDLWAPNVETVNTDYGLNDIWGEGTVEFVSDYALNDNWGTLVE